MTTLADTVWGAAILALAALTIWRIVLMLRRQRRHRRRANQRFITGYRAGYHAALHHERRTTVEAAASSMSQLPVVRPRRPADAGDPDRSRLPGFVRLLGGNGRDRPSA